MLPTSEMKPKHILHLNAAEKQQFLDSFDIVLSDCDGVLWMISVPIPNTGAAINLLKGAGKSFKFVSNNDGMRSDEDYLNKLEKIGAKQIVKDDFILPYKVFARYMKINYPGETCYCLGTEIFSKSLEATGVKVLNVTPPFNVGPEQLRSVVTRSEAAKIVAVSIHINMTFPELALIHQYLLKDDCLVFANATDTRVPVTEELTIIGPGVVLNALTDCTEKDYIIFGKPSDMMGEFLIEEFQIKDRSRGLFVGDNLTFDIQYAARLGLQTLFVLNGAHTMEEMLLQPLEDQPDYYADSLGDFVEFFNNLTANTNK